jgi:prolyl-tRNA editing enzyme YbaK/EbsC (Cys-tRNA(Pro) deacylase)
MLESTQAKLDGKVASALDLHRMDYRVLACDPDLADTSAFCEYYGYTLEQAANTIIVATKGEPVKFACCVVLAVTKLDVNKKVSALLGTKKLSFATADQTLALTGMQIGGVTPFGLLTLPIYIDSKILHINELVFGGGNRSSKVLLAPAELLKMPGVEFIEDLGIAKQAP